MDRLELSQANFLEIVTQPGIVVVRCWAPWCGACKQFSPIYESVANRYSDITFTSLDTEAEETLSRDLGIEHIPTLMVFRDGVPVFCQPGNFAETGLIDIINQAQTLDLEMVKQEMAVDLAVDGLKEDSHTTKACP